MPMLIIILNNNGIYSGVDELPSDISEIPVTALNPKVKYELIAEGLGAVGYLITDLSGLEKTLPKAIE